VKQIAGDQVDIMTMVAEGHVPETAQPGPRKLARLQQADVIIVVGHPSLFFEKRYITSNRKVDSKAVWVSMYEVAKNMQPLRELEGTDPHLWTSPAIMLATARSVADSLAYLDPENSKKYRRGRLKLATRVKKLDTQLREYVKASEFKEILVYHPAWGHFSQDYGLTQLAIEVEGKAPGPGSLSNIIRVANKKSLKFIVSSPGTDQRQAGIIAAQLQATVLVIDPMDADWMNMMLKMKTAVKMTK